ncbi:SGNH/GDSL hydrolase family protein [Haloarchaeobius sp. DFWS5]|uniref:SGNH/GDSL hydrolase family protein n=1 Tax=Haloarchaeobius sp. DFWS5 TaxID=3446114 RepID=UPI003EC0F0B2
MRHDEFDFHNVAELREPDEEDHDTHRDGLLLQRVPESVRQRLNDGAQRRMRHPAGVELRFVPDGPVEVTLSTIPVKDRESGTVRVFWGPFQTHQTVEIGPEPTTIRVEFPEKLADIVPEVREELSFDPRVCRICLPGEHRGGHMVYHSAEGDRRPPVDDELPDTRYLAYGTSITEGEAPLAEHLTYASQTATRLGAELVNLGSCGTAYCDPAMAEFIAGRDDWDVATLALSVNMVGRFPVETFEERAAAMVDAVASAHPEKPVGVVTIYTNGRDVCAGHSEAVECEQFRESLRRVVKESSQANVHLFEGPAIIDGIEGMTPDLTHPGDNAMIRMGENLASELQPLLSE